MELLQRNLKQKTGIIFLCVFLTSSFIQSCKEGDSSVIFDFDKIPDRVWVGEDFWTVPLEDWSVNNKRVECRSVLQSASLSILSYVLSDKEDPFFISVDMGLLDPGNNKGSSGLSIGVEATEEKDVRAAVYFGTGLNLGVNTGGYAFLGSNTIPLPEKFDFKKLRLELTGEKVEDNYKLTLKVFDEQDHNVAELNVKPERQISGIVQFVNNIKNPKSRNNGPQFWYDNIIIKGSKFIYQPDNQFGPILWAMYTSSKEVLKITAQLPPIEETGNTEAELFLKNGNKWQSIRTARMDTDARTVTWKIEEWDSSIEKSYKILFKYINSLGRKETGQYTGIIPVEPLDRPLRMGALTCQYHYGFPYSPLVRNLELSKPDILYFSGDQIYEANGGYPIKREPEDVAILNYLGKWYMFGWAFGDLMRNVPTICTPDDHDMFQGNVWGEEGAEKTEDGNDAGGFEQTVKWVNVVNRSQCAHLPDPYDPSPMQRGINVWYTALNYGRISFAIVSDRYFKSAPKHVSHWEGRQDHVQKPLKSPDILEKPGLEFLGKRQEEFLEDWIYDWNDVDMKVLLSQTLFANVATHHGQYDYFLYGDMDSGGWPKTARDRALRILRKAFVFHISGDQHVPSLVQYGIDDFRDAGWCFTTPAIAVGYSRWFRPDELGIPVKNRPSHGFPNTGEYKDIFGNLNYVYAIGNPDNYPRLSDRYEFAQVKTSGYGMVIFDRNSRNITMESWRFLANTTNPGIEDQHPGWPFTINQLDNYGRKALVWLPKLIIQGDRNPVVEISNSKNNETIYILRINGNEFRPWAFEEGLYNIKLGFPETETWKSVEKVLAGDQDSKEEIVITF